MIPFDELCAAIDRHRLGATQGAPTPTPPPPAPPARRMLVQDPSPPLETEILDEVVSSEEEVL